MQSTSPVLIAQDLSAVGTISMKVAIPILSSLGIRISLLPTVLLSTQTEGFHQPIRQDLSPWIEQTVQHWRHEGIHFGDGLIGYLGNEQLVDQLTGFVENKMLPTIVLDPVMGDHRLLYPGLPSNYPQTMQQLLSHARITVPNITEAQLLTGITVSDFPTKADKKSLLLALENEMPAGGHAIITGVAVDNQLGCTWLENGDVNFYGHQSLAGHFYGSGDVFAALLTGFLNRQEPLNAAIKLATNGTFLALQTTEKSSLKRRFGIDLSQLLVALANYVRTGALTS